MDVKVLRTIREFNMLCAGDYVIVALSGGADSAALLHVLHRHAPSLGIRLAAAHFEHGLRGRESLRDAAFAGEVCARYGVPFFLEHGRMNEREKTRGEGTEAAARRLRYAFFARLCEEHGAKVATAHTLSDNAETVLFNLARGAGPRGLAGIPPVRDTFVRPMLRVSRAEVEAYCAANGVGYVQDSSNTSREFSRNRLRHDVLPMLEAAHAGAQRALARGAEDMRVLNEWIERQAAELLARAAREGAGGRGYAAEVLRAAPAPLRLAALSRLAGGTAGRAALGRMERVLDGSVRSAQLPGGAVARRVGGRLAVGPPPEAVSAGYEFPLAEGRLELPGGYAVEISAAEKGAEMEFLEKTSKKSLTFFGDYDKILGSVFRTRRPRDVFSPAGRGVAKELRRWMNEAGIDPLLRARWPLLAAGGRVLWVWGGGICDEARVNSGTRRVLVITQEERQGGRHEGSLV